ncbi:DUF2975 domain-containing protein [Dinghuibacter silviterrae]|uniref:DUF2975 family protein n=1 Tax=Dinghuibacter silviterrae TaxID=1539049 RepID=A0A4R8DMY5_9BACT|nr:DUF2975 domain-containing protein [Dinghuibacter silviterrae]TDW99047.1 DUF2975 family protein [Dinghuibacter silviterrae]
MTISTTKTLKVLYVLAWIIFVGVSIEAGGFIFSTIYTLEINPVNAHRSWPGLDLSSLYDYDRGYFLAEMVQISLVSVMRAVLFYLIIDILHNNKLDIARPFSKNVGRFLFRVSYLSLLIGLFSWFGTKYTEWLVSKGVKLPDLQDLRLGGADVWLFMGVTIYVIAQIFKRGIDLQTENELTV